jgi:NAD(P)-dependent dehydrogenase (short-subunit alcohol dehydrogenase family)
MKKRELHCLVGKKAFVTGGARGMGKCAALALAEAGANVAIVDADEALAALVAAEVEGLGVRSFAVRCDVADPSSVDAMVRRVLEEFGTIDIAFNNGGLSVCEGAEAMSFESWERMIDFNLTGVYLTANAAGRVMIAKGGGSIINATSLSGCVVDLPQPQCAYTASKAGVIMLTKSLAVEWARSHVRVNSISPAGREERPEALAAALVYLAGGGSTFTTGSDIVIDDAFACA